MKKAMKTNSIPHPNCIGLKLADHLAEIMLNLPLFEDGDRLKIQIAGIPKDCQGGCEVMQTILGFYKEKGIEIGFAPQEKMEMEMLKQINANAEPDMLLRLLSEMGIIPHNLFDNDEVPRKRGEKFSDFLMRKLSH